MSYAENISKLRKIMQDVISKGLVTGKDKDFFEATLIQIMNDAEKQKQNCIAQADNLRRQASQIDGQAQAFSSVSSIVWSVLNGFVIAAEKAELEEKARQAELEENKKEIEEAKKIALNQ